jgi:hypothetical protein
VNNGQHCIISCKVLKHCAIIDHWIISNFYLSRNNKVMKTWNSLLYLYLRVFRDEWIIVVRHSEFKSSDWMFTASWTTNSFVHYKYYKHHFGAKLWGYVWQHLPNGNLYCRELYKLANIFYNCECIITTVHSTHSTLYRKFSFKILAWNFLPSPSIFIFFVFVYKIRVLLVLNSNSVRSNIYSLCGNSI